MKISDERIRSLVLEESDIQRRSELLEVIRLERLTRLLGLPAQEENGEAGLRQTAAGMRT